MMTLSDLHQQDFALYCECGVVLYPGEDLCEDCERTIYYGPSPVKEQTTTGDTMSPTEDDLANAGGASSLPAYQPTL